MRTLFGTRTYKASFIRILVFVKPPPLNTPLTAAEQRPYRERHLAISVNPKDWLLAVEAWLSSPAWDGFRRQRSCRPGPGL